MSTMIERTVMLMDIVVVRSGSKNYKMNIIDNAEKILYN